VLGKAGEEEEREEMHARRRSEKRIKKEKRG